MTCIQSLKTTNVFIIHFKGKTQILWRFEEQQEFCTQNDIKFRLWDMGYKKYFHHFTAGKRQYITYI